MKMLPEWLWAFIRPAPSIMRRALAASWTDYAMLLLQASHKGHSQQTGRCGPCSMWTASQ